MEELGKQFNIDIKENKADILVSLVGNLSVNTPNEILKNFINYAKKTQVNKYTNLKLNFEKIEYLDLAGVAQIFHVLNFFENKVKNIEWLNIPENFLPIYKLAQEAMKTPSAAKEKKLGLFAEIGRKTSLLFKDLSGLIFFTGQLLMQFIYFLRNPGKIRWKEVFKIMEIAGVNALPVISLVAFLIGLIIAFQSAVLMKLFGAEIYVADLVAISVVRELGPLMTAIVFAGRSGSAFSAELGAMKAGQEIDAFVTMGLDPVRDLVGPRMIAAILVIPMITVIAEFVGLLGGNVVLYIMGFPVSVYWAEVVGILRFQDFASGLFKAAVFGLTVAAVGCQRGLIAEKSPGAVGAATTSGVVSNIILIAVLDSLFAVVFYVLGI